MKMPRSRLRRTAYHIVEGPELRDAARLVGARLLAAAGDDGGPF